MLFGLKGSYISLETQAKAPDFVNWQLALIRREMRNHWLFFIDPDKGSPSVMPIEPLLSGGHLLSQLSSFLDNALHQSRSLYAPGSMACQEAFNCMSKFAGAFALWFSSVSSSNLSRQILGNQSSPRPGSCNSSKQVKQATSSRRSLTGFQFGFRTQDESFSPVDFGKISSFMMRLLHKEAERLQSFSVLSLASALVPPFDKLSSKVLAVPLGNGDIEVHCSVDQRPCEVERCGCPGLLFPELSSTRHAVEPRTGIEFPTILGNIFAGKNKSDLMSEVLVGTGSRTMKIIKIKSLKIYAFGFYVHPNSVCEKLGPKYASIPAVEMNKHHEFYQDLLREDIGMTVRLVINCNGIKINTVKDALEKSLRARLLKTNPDTDYHCLRKFGSLFPKDIPLHAGTTVDFRRTADGQLITEIEGNQIGAVDSKDLCRAFFDMYIGDLPVSEQAKEDIGKNVASILQRC